MKRFVMAWKAFWRVLAEGDRAPELPASRETESSRNGALDLLAALQREARFVDFIKEPLDAYTDAQIGAAARDIHRDAGKTLDRLFGFSPLREEKENATVDVPEDFDAEQVHLTGRVAGSPPYRGVLRHHGWKADHCDVPAWTGREESVRVVAPAEVELS